MERKAFVSALRCIVYFKTLLFDPARGYFDPRSSSVVWVDFASAEEGDERKNRDGSDEIAKDLVDGDGGNDGDAGGAGGDG